MFGLRRVWLGEWTRCFVLFGFVQQIKPSSLLYIPPHSARESLPKE